MEETYKDEIGRMFCTKHRREICHECCYDFADMNRMYEEDAGLRQPKTELEKAAEEALTMSDALIRMRREMGMGPGDPVYEQNRSYAEEKQELFDTLKATAEPQEIEAAMRKAIDKIQKQHADRNAIIQAWAKENPGKREMEFGGPETQRLYDEFAAAPTLSVKNSTQRVDKFTCSYCGKASAKKLDCCSRCKLASYCNATCQTKAWKVHKKTCVPIEKELKSLKVLSWEQVEAHGGLPVEGKTLQVRAMVDESMMRQVYQCKDRLGVVHRVAAYTNSRGIPGLKQGAVLKWKNPKFHYFMDGSKGARIEEEDLVNVTVTN